MKEKILLLALSFAVACMSAAPVLADESRVRREYRFDVDGISDVEIKANVGSIEIIPTDGDELEVLLDIEGQKEGWFPFRRGLRDVSDVELESDVRGKRLILEQTASNTETDWVIYMPAVAYTSIDLGVGDLDAEFHAMDLDIDIGVGDVDIVFPREAAGHISLDVGVGDAEVHGARDVDAERAIVSQTVRARGDGDMDIRVDIGVGDIDLDLD